MRKRYRTGAKSKLTSTTKSDYYDDMLFIPYLTVYEEEDAVFDTGLLDECGTPIHYTLEREPIGYIKKGDD